MWLNYKNTPLIPEGRSWSKGALRALSTTPFRSSPHARCWGGWRGRGWGNIWNKETLFLSPKILPPNWGEQMVITITKKKKKSNIIDTENTEEIQSQERLIPSGPQGTAA